MSETQIQKQEKIIIPEKQIQNVYNTLWKKIKLPKKQIHNG